MSFISFKKTGLPDPLKELELVLGGCINTGIYWPPKEIHEFLLADIKTVNGLDIEAEAFRNITEELCELFPPLGGEGFGRTRLEIVIAITSSRGSYLKERT
jgi:hypothetical protein